MWWSCRIRITERRLVMAQNVLRGGGAGGANLPFSAPLCHAPKSTHQSHHSCGPNQGRNCRRWLELIPGGRGEWSRHGPRTSSGWLGSQPGTRAGGDTPREVIPLFPASVLARGSGNWLSAHGKQLVVYTLMGSNPLAWEKHKSCYLYRVRYVAEIGLSYR